MAIEVKVPALGESLTEGTISRWLKDDGAAARLDEPLLLLKTDKASVEIPAPASGVLRLLKKLGDTVRVGEVVARIEEGAVPAAAPAKPAPTQATPAAPATQAAQSSQTELPSKAVAHPVLAPSVRRMVTEHSLDPEGIPATGRGGRITSEDVLNHLKSVPVSAPSATLATLASAVSEAALVAGASNVSAAPAGVARTGGARRVPMTRLRQRIAERLVQAQHTAAILTTFNEVDMSAVMDWRTRHKERFQKRHGLNLGFVSFFAKAACAAMQDVPIVGAQIDGADMVQFDGVHLGIAVATERGLVVPVVRDADSRSLAGVEKEIARLAALARENKLGPADLSGGTFTLTNGGVFGSLLSTPILNPPQSAILGMHKIEKRAVVVDDQIVIRPMMYVALSYDHRLVDGEQAVTFLVRVKERLEDPSRMLLDV